MSGFDQAGEYTVLVVDDDVAALRVIVRMLFRLGFKVLHAESGEQALVISERYNGRIDLLLADLILPGSSGPALACLLRSKRPDVKILYMSRHQSEYLELTLLASESLIHKPFSAGQLAAHVRDLLQDMRAGYRD